MATEQRSYKVIQKEPEFEIRFYPPAGLASVQVSGGYEAARGEGFNELAGYIFGGNSEGRKIAMTAPVIMDIQPDVPEGTMSFVLPSSFDMDSRPLPRSSRIFFQTTEPVYAAVVTFGGYASTQDLEKHKADLLKALDRKGIKHSEQAEFYFYDPPYKFLGRRNEVVVLLPGFTKDIQAASSESATT
jgi:hypothetical protein